MDDEQIAAPVRKWAKSGGAERANYQLFLIELCDVLGVERLRRQLLTDPIFALPC